MVKHHGLRPAAYLARHDFLGPRLFAAHCRYVDAGEIALLGKSGTIVSHQAAMAANRGVIPPIPALRDGRLPDRERHRQQHQRHARSDAGGAPDRTHPPRRRLSRRAAAARRHPRGHDARWRARDQTTAVGTLEVGKKADLIVLDTLRAHLVPAVRILSAWMHNGQPSDIESVMVDGQFVMRDRKILTVDEIAMVAEADKVGRRVWAEIQSKSPIVIPGRQPKR